MKKIIMVSLFCLISLGATASTIEPVVHLLSLKMLKVSERTGDDLYMHVTEYPSHQKPRNFTIPKLPLYWQSKHLNKIDDLILWDSHLEDGQSATVFFSLMDHDFPPWNTDDLVGTIKLKIRNEKGETKYEWSIPNSTVTPEVVVTKKGEARKFTLMGENGQYEVFLLMSVK